jgi:hypothetical protein
VYEDSSSGSNYIDLIGASSVASNKVITLPDATGTVCASGSGNMVLNATTGDMTISNTPTFTGAVIIHDKIKIVNSGGNIRFFNTDLTETSQYMVEQTAAGASSFNSVGTLYLRISDGVKAVVTSSRLLVYPSTEATSTTNGAIATYGGISCAKKLFVGGSSTRLGNASISNSGSSVWFKHVDSTRPAILCSNGLTYIDADSSVFIKINGANKVLIDGTQMINYHTTDSTSGSTGAYNTQGGIGCAKSLYVGANISYVGSLTDVSDRRLKNNITPLTSNLEKVNAMKPCSFILNDKMGEECCGLLKYGFIAQELRAIDEELVTVRPFAFHPPATVRGKLARKLREDVLMQKVAAIFSTKYRAESIVKRCLTNWLLKYREAKLLDEPEPEPYEIEDLHLVKQSNIMPLAIGAINELTELVKSLTARIIALEAV